MSASLVDFKINMWKQNTKLILTCSDAIQGPTQTASISDSGPYAFKVENF
jgi:hypothetical protein